MILKVLSHRQPLPLTGHFLSPLSVKAPLSRPPPPPAHSLCGGTLQLLSVWPNTTPLLPLTYSSPPPPSTHTHPASFCVTQYHSPTSPYILPPPPPPPPAHTLCGGTLQFLSVWPSTTPLLPLTYSHPTPPQHSVWSVTTPLLPSTYSPLLPPSPSTHTSWYTAGSFCVTQYHSPTSPHILPPPTHTHPASFCVTQYHSPTSPHILPPHTQFLSVWHNTTPLLPLTYSRPPLPPSPPQPPEAGCCVRTYADTLLPYGPGPAANGQNHFLQERRALQRRHWAVVQHVVVGWLRSCAHKRAQNNPRKFSTQEYWGLSTK